MAKQRTDSNESAGLKWGPFTLRLPFYHTRFCGPEFLQGLLVSAATGLALVPLLQMGFGLSFEEAVLMSIFHSLLIASSPIVFGEPFASGWITPALPLVLTFVLADAFPTAQDKFQVMTALSIDLAILLLVLGVSGLGRRLMAWIPATIKAAIIMGAALSAFKRVFVDDAANNLFAMPVSMTIAMAVCLLFSFSIPLNRYKLQFPWLQTIASLGLLPGFVLAGIAGIIVGEMSFVDSAGGSIIQWGILDPPFASLYEKVSPFSIGFPSLSLLLDPDIIGLALVAYIILFGDILTGMEVIKQAQGSRPDETIEFDTTRTHLSVGIRNALMAVTAPFFPTQGSLWTGVHVIIVNRWKEGRQAMDSLHSGISSYYIFGLPLFYMALPVVTGLKPFMPIALVLTLVLTGFACAYVAMAMPRTPIERGVVMLGGAALALLSPVIGLSVALLAHVSLVGFDKTSDP